MDHEQYLLTRHTFHLFNTLQKYTIALKYGLNNTKAMVNKAIEIDDIMTANGVMTLSVPVVKGSSIKILTKDVQVDYSTNWQKLHFKGIESAYKNSPYYDYYIDNFMHFFERKEKFLLDLNTKILKELMDNLQLQRPIKLTEDYYPTYDTSQTCGMLFTPKPSRRRVEDPSSPNLTTKPCRKIPFAPNLSILDLLFNMGPESQGYL